MLRIWHDFDHSIKPRGTTGALMYQLFSKSIYFKVPYPRTPLSRCHCIYERIERGFFVWHIFVDFYLILVLHSIMCINFRLAHSDRFLRNKPIANKQHGFFKICIQPNIIDLAEHVKRLFITVFGSLGLVAEALDLHGEGSLIQCPHHFKKVVPANHNTLGSEQNRPQFAMSSVHYITMTS